MLIASLLRERKVNIIPVEVTMSQGTWGSLRNKQIEVKDWRLGFVHQSKLKIESKKQLWLLLFRFIRQIAKKPAAQI